MHLPSDTLADFRQQFTFSSFAVENLRRLLSRTQIGTFYDSSPLDLIGLIEEIANDLEKKLQSIQEEYAGFEELTGFEELNRERLRGVAIISVTLVTLVRYITGAGVQNVPWGLSGQLNRLCESFDSSIHLIIRLRWRHHYSYIEAKDEIIRRCFYDPDVLRILDKHHLFVILSLPQAENDNSLQHATLAHELSHLLQKILGKEMFGAMETSGGHISSEERDLVSYIFHQMSEDSQTIRNLFPLDMSQVISEILRSWTTEVVCDLLAIRLFGPSALFSFHEIIDSLHEVSDIRKSHPPAILRMKWMLSELKCQGFLDFEENKALQPYAPMIQQYIRRLESRTCDAPSQVDRELAILLDVFEREIVPYICRIVRSLDRNYFVKSKVLLANLPYLLSLLERNIPPNIVEITPANPYSTRLHEALNAGWLYWLKHIYEIQRHDLRISNVVPIRKKINQLVLKAIESSEFQTEFLERKERRESSKG